MRKNSLSWSVKAIAVLLEDRAADEQALGCCDAHTHHFGVLWGVDHQARTLTLDLADFPATSAEVIGVTAPGEEYE
jgi:hypothetical protein